jgi:hypothetical protein
MQKTLLALLMLAGLSFQSHAFASSDLRADVNQTFSRKNAIAKDTDFLVLKKQGKLFFTFTPTLPTDVFNEFDITVAGKWQAFVVTPDDKTFAGPVIDTTMPPGQFTITVDHKILFGTYTVIIKDLTATGYPTDFTSTLITVTNSFNNQAVDVAVTSQNAAFNEGIPNSFITLEPGNFVQGSFVPYHPFLPH